MKKKKDFSKAEVEVIYFEKSDVITTSGCNPDVGQGGSEDVDLDEE